MKSNTKTTNPTTSTRAERYARYSHLATMWYAAPLSDSDLSELKTLAKEFCPKMAKYMEENPEMC